MKYQILFAVAGVCLLLTACAEKTTEIPEAATELQTASPVITEIQSDLPATEQNIQTVTETPATEEMTVPAVPSSPEELIGIWQNPETKHVYWFQENGLYVTMLYMGTFPEDIGIEMTETEIKLTISGEVQQLTQAGTHVFDTLDGLYNVAGQNYQILIVGNAVYTYTDTGATYQYNGEALSLQDVQIPCIIDGDTMQYEHTTFSRTHELDDFLLSQETGGN